MMPWRYFSKWEWTVHVAKVGSNADRPGMMWSVSNEKLLGGCVLIVLVILTVLTTNNVKKFLQPSKLIKTSAKMGK